ncbi:hypothetical protein CRUP_010067 [Coryphaenoides rupestris]|nr:hypothetical protein CRUP_010067 [Coryphaenoides rupestris]
MSAAQTQKESGEAGWGSLEALGLSQKELVLAEALQMEYDALSRLKHDQGGPDQGGPGQGLSSGQSGSKPLVKFPTQSSVERPRPVPGVPSPTGGDLLRGLSGSDSSLNQPAGSQSPPRPSVSRPAPLRGALTKEPLYILDSEAGDHLGPSFGSSYGTGSRPAPKGAPPPPGDMPPAIPPRNPILQGSGSDNPFLPARGPAAGAPRDVNLFTPDGDRPKFPSEEFNYESLNAALDRLNSERQAARSRRTSGEQPGKPVARSKTLPPQIPPRTYMPAPKSNRNQRRVSADPVSLGSRANGFSYELFQVSEERDEEVAAYCHMLDVLRSAYPSSEASKNTGFVWSPSVAHQELQQGLGVSVKVTVISDHFREPLTFTCDGSSTMDLLIYQTLCYAQDDLDVDVDQYLLKVCGQAEYLHK